MEVFDAKPAFGRLCPRCRNFSCFQYQNGQNDNEDESSYYCDACDREHKRPIPAERIHRGTEG